MLDLRTNVSRRTSRWRPRRRLAPRRRAESRRDETETLGSLTLESLRRRRRHLASTRQRGLVGDVIAEVDQAPAGLVVREVTDLASVETIKVGQDSVDRVELVVGEYGQ